MRSLALLGGFLASTFVSIVGTVATPAANSNQNQPIRTIAYNVFGKPVQAERANELTVVTMGENCPWCVRQEPVIDRLVKEGYQVTVIDRSDYQPDEKNPAVTTYPSLIFKRGDKVVKVNPGYLPYEKITPQLEAPPKPPRKKLLPLIK